MTRYVALLRAVNVGGHNRVAMADLRAAAVSRGYRNVTTYINSGNALFDADADRAGVQADWLALVRDDLGVDVPVCVLGADEIVAAVGAAPDWWNRGDRQRHEAVFAVPPLTGADVAGRLGPPPDGGERVAACGQVLFWSGPMSDYAHTGWAKATGDKALHRAITVRNAATTLRLAALAR